MSDVVAVIDYGMGNLHSAGKALEKVASGQQIVITGDPDQVRAADRVVFPGVGAIRDCIAVLRDTGLDRAILDVIAAGKPVLGICVGMQLLAETGREDGATPGLEWIGGEVSRIQPGEGLRVPHMGWNDVTPGSGRVLFDALDEDPRFYFLHSYYVEPAEQSDVAATAHYGFDFACAIHRDNVWGVQFHPEKSHHFGAAVLKSFAEL